MILGRLAVWATLQIVVAVVVFPIAYRMDREVRSDIATVRSTGTSVQALVTARHYRRRGGSTMDLSVPVPSGSIGISVSSGRVPTHYVGSREYATVIYDPDNVQRMVIVDPDGKSRQVHGFRRRETLVAVLSFGSVPLFYFGLVALWDWRRTRRALGSEQYIEATLESVTGGNRVRTPVLPAPHRLFRRRRVVLRLANGASITVPILWWKPGRSLPPGTPLRVRRRLTAVAITDAEDRLVAPAGWLSLAVR